MLKFIIRIYNTNKKIGVKLIMGLNNTLKMKFEVKQIFDSVNEVPNLFIWHIDNLTVHIGDSSNNLI